MRQHAAVAGKAERQPIIGAMQGDSQTLGVGDANLADTGEQRAQRGQLQQHQEPLLQL